MGFFVAGIFFDLPFWLGWQDSNLRNDGVKVRCLTDLATSQYLVFAFDIITFLVPDVNRNVIKLPLFDTRKTTDKKIKFTDVEFLPFSDIIL